LGLYPTSLPERYSTAKLENGIITNFKNKAKDGYEYAFIGIAGVYNYGEF